MTNKKITKRDFLNAIRANVENGAFSFDGDIATENVLEFIDHELELLDNKAAAAAKRAKAKRDAGDQLRATILDLMSTEDFMTINDIVKALGDEDISAQMVTARMTQALKAGLVEKDSVSVEVNGKSKKLSAYRKLA